MSKELPYTMRDVNYNNDKSRHRSFIKVITNAVRISNLRGDCATCSTGKFLILLLCFGLIYVLMVDRGPEQLDPELGLEDTVKVGSHNISAKSTIQKLLLRRPPRLPPRLPSFVHTSKDEASKWPSRQQKVKEAFVHAWAGYRSYALGYDELMPLSHKGTDGLGGLGATVVDSLDTAIIMGLDEIVSEAGSWIETHLSKRISEKGQVNLFETTIRVLGGLLSAYHLSGGHGPTAAKWGPSHVPKGPKPEIYLKIAKDLADRLMYAFTLSPTPVPYSDVILQSKTAHPAPDGLSSTSEVATLQLEFSYLSNISGDPKYNAEAMKVFEHIKNLPKVEGLVPIYISPHTGEFSGENIRLGSRGDSYYEYLIKVWLQQGSSRDYHLKFLHEMYEEAMKGVRHLLVRKSIPKGLVFVGELPYGSKGSFSPKMDHLVCFLPGALALGATKGLTKKKAMDGNLLTIDDLENLKLAEELATTCNAMYSVTATGLAPEIAYFHVEGEFEDGLDGGNKSSEYMNDIMIKPNDRHNLLRPETVESLFVLYRITKDPKYREWGWQIFQDFEKYTKVETGGYTSLDDVTTIPPRRRDKMETFFLGETLKYLYLLFGDENVLPLDEFVFNTEAHPLPINWTARMA
ncbi:unnamed protein product [Victoria cruziana]